MDIKLIAIILFAITYVLLLVLPKYRSYVAVISAAIFVLIDIVPYNMALGKINWNVLLMIIGTMGVVSLFIESKMPSLMADIIIEKTPNVKWAIVLLSLFAGFISAFIDNVATVLMFAPVALVMCKKLKISPVLPVIAIALSSNLQGAATLVGDTTSILLGAEAGLNFWDFFFFNGKIGLFWVVQLGALASVLILLFVFRKETQPVESFSRTEVKDYFPTVLLVLIVVLLIVASFIPNTHPNTNGFICIALFAVGLVNKIIQTKDFKSITKAISEIDFQTIILLASLFIIIAALTEVGVVNDISKFFVRVSHNNVFLAYTFIVWGSVLISAFVDNIPYVATMLPVVAGVATSLELQNPYLLYFGLVIGSTLGGNLTPIGASANITGIGILRKEGYEVKTWDFMKLGIPFTLAAVFVGYVLIYLIWR